MLPAGEILIHRTGRDAECVEDRGSQVFRRLGGLVGVTPDLVRSADDVPTGNATSGKQD